MFVLRLLLSVMLGAVVFVACNEHTTDSSPNNQDRNGFMNADSIPFVPGNVSYQDSLAVSLSLNSYETINYRQPRRLEAYGVVIVHKDSAHIGIGPMIIGSATVQPYTIEYEPGFPEVEYRIHDIETALTPPHKPLFGGLARWMVPTNSRGIPTLDTSIQSLPYLNVQTQGLTNGKIATTASFTVSWQPSAISTDSVSIAITYDGFMPFNANFGLPQEIRRYVATVPDANGSITIPSAILGLLPANAVFEVEVERRRFLLWLRGDKYINISHSNNARDLFQTLP